MTREELVKRLRALCNCNIDTSPCGAEGDCRVCFAAADMLEVDGKAFRAIIDLDQADGHELTWGDASRAVNIAHAALSAARERKGE